MTAPDSGAAPRQPYDAVSPDWSHVPTGQPTPAQPGGWVPAPSTGQFPAAQSPAMIQPRRSVPPVPPGPGVQPPFAAPPMRKEAGTLAVAFIVGGLVLLLCLAGGGIGLGTAVYTATVKTEEQVTAAATAYLEALVDERYGDAYRMTCDTFRRKVPQQEYVTEKRGVPLDGYNLRSITPTRDGRLMVQAEVRSVNGMSRTLGLVMVWEAADSSGGRGEELRVRVCGEVDNPTPAPS